MRADAQRNGTGPNPNQDFICRMSRLGVSFTLVANLSWLGVKASSAKFWIPSNFPNGISIGEELPHPTSCSLFPQLITKIPSPDKKLCKGF
jgi:hypothetical protein